MTAVVDPPATGVQPAPLRDEIVGGVLGTLGFLAVPLCVGLLAFAPLGAGAGAVGLVAAFVATAIGGLVHAAFSRARLPAAGPNSATALMLAGLLGALTADPRLAPGQPGAVPVLLAGCALAVALAGAIQVLLAAGGLAGLARLVPRPVLAGFMNGVALLIVLAQVPLLLGALPGQPADGARLAAALAQPLPLLLALAALASLLALQRVRPQWPAAALVLVAGTALAQALPALQPGWSAGPAIGPVPVRPPDPLALLPLLRPAAWPLLVDHAATLVGTALVIALVGGLESLLSQQALDEQMQSRHEPGRELAALGVANLVTGLLGGLPVVQTRVRALATRRAGGSRAMATVAGSLAVGLVYVAGAPLLALLPLPLLAATMVVAGIGLADGWSGRLLRHGWRGDTSAELRAGLWVMLAVCGVTLWLGFAAGVLLGVLLSMAIFVARMNRSLLRARATAAERPSRRIYPPDLEARLQPLRATVVLWELEGALFFGNADRLLALADSLPPGTRSLVIDLARVGSVDESGAATFGRLAGLMAHRSVTVHLAGLTDGSALARTLRAHGIELPRWPDADRAIEAAEQGLLGPAAESTLKARPLLESDLMQGLAEADAAIVQAAMQERRLFEGQALFRQGDEADGLYVLTVGSVSVVGHGDGRTQRYLSLSPGMMVGETAMLDGGRRSADAVADGFAVLHHLDAASLAELVAAHPAIAARLHRNIAVHLSRRLRAASAAWWGGPR